MAMIDTADIVAERYKLSREYQDEYSLESQRRMAAAQQANKFKDEIVPITAGGETISEDGTLAYFGLAGRNSTDDSEVISVALSTVFTRSLALLISFSDSQ